MTRGRPRGSYDLHGRCVRATVHRGKRHSRSRTPAYAVLCRDFGEQLTAVMRERAIASSELAAAINVLTQTVMAWRRGVSIPAVASLSAMAVAMSCALIDLMPESARYR